MAEINLSEKFPRMTPAKAPPMFRMNGCGFALYGRRDRDAETGAYVSTLCLSLVFIPVFCLRAYRVANAKQGWYFLGREPLSAFARGWNYLLLGAIIAGVGISGYIDYTGSASYKAKQQMAEAHRLADAGHLGDAARIYRSLAQSGSQQAASATAAIQDLVDNRCPQSPLSESASVFGIAAPMARRGQVLAPADIAGKGLKIVGDKGDSDPRWAVALLDTIRPLVIDPRPIDARRLPLLRKWAAVEPNNLDVVAPLALLLADQGKSDEAKKLLLPLKDRLGNGDGARVLGMILAREGDYDGAYSLLWPYVKPRLDNLHAAESAVTNSAREVQNREIGILDAEKGPADFYQRYKNANKDAQRGIVREYLDGKIKNDPQFINSQDALERESAVVPVALELGMVMLQRAQGQSDPQARKAQLESAEQVFLAIGGQAGQSDAYRVSLGQVYYWLGKQAEGAKLFDEFLSDKGRAAEDLLVIAKKLREVGAVPQARAMSEEAYNKATKPEERYAVAGFRAVCFKDLDDRIAWLNKTDTGDPSDKAALAKALGDKAFREGRDDDAARQYRSVVAAYEAMPRSAMTLNETALAYEAIFQATGDRQALERCSDNFQQAVDLSPSDSILLYNAGSTLLSAALGDVIGNDIDLRALHDTGGVYFLGFLYTDQATRNAIARRVMSHPGIGRALSYLEKVTVLSPKNANAFEAIYSIHRFTRNDAALAALEKRIRDSSIDTSDELAAMKEYQAGRKDEQNKASLTASLKRCEDLSAALRPTGGRTVGVAVSEQVGVMLAMAPYGEAPDFDKAIQLAEECQHLVPSVNSAGLLVTTHLARAQRDLCRSDPAFNAFYNTYYRSISSTILMAFAASEPSTFQQKVLQNTDVRRAIEIQRQQSALFPEGLAAYEWAMLKAIDPAEAAKAAEAIRNTPRLLVQQSISTLLNPGDANGALETYWLMQIHNKPEEGRRALRKVAALGVPVPMQP